MFHELPADWRWGYQPESDTVPFYDIVAMAEKGLEEVVSFRYQTLSALRQEFILAIQQPDHPLRNYYPRGVAALKSALTQLENQLRVMEGVEG